MPVEWTPQSEELFLDLVQQGWSLPRLGADGRFPSNWDISRRIRTDEAFRRAYAQAKLELADSYAEEIVTISDDSGDDVQVRENSRTGETYEVTNHEVVQRSKLRVDTRKWLMSKLQPRKYGDLVKHEISGPDAGPMRIDATMTPQQAMEAYVGTLKQITVDE